ncbi:putative metal-dependent hydrolase [Streptomyces candidus]|uniref:Putative metal-dependent hydrolase n=1 Tax=Streptomyces candidus TaxID=67283 RepID=A0A7X0HGR5_9ACTN|nr:metal-dependent hydrolase [Streptomyces candidus]MBB6437246.1 putative metal-dependent hydrolase [Streptomyces candidus]GHH38350.1 hydrolase [Streptomyces candidus]
MSTVPRPREQGQQSDEGHVIVPRRVSFDWQGTPLHWIPDEPTATHVINVLQLDLLRRHGAEEVEHRAVAFDMYQHCGGGGPPRYARRIEVMVVVAPVVLWLWAWGASYLIRHDPRLAGRLRYSLREHNRALAKGLLPDWRELGSAIPCYSRRSYHPSQEGSLRRAVEYLATSPAAGAVGRAALRP